jgi:hypothetical protein
MKLNTRVRFKDKPFLSDGYIYEIIEGYDGADAYIIKLDEKAPNEYAWETDEVLSFGNDIEEIEL